VTGCSGLAGDIIIAGPLQEAPSGARPPAPVLPYEWADRVTYVLTSPADFLGTRSLLQGLLHAFLPWDAGALPVGELMGGGRQGAGQEDPGEAPHERLAGAAVLAANAGRACVFAAVDGSPWIDPLARAIIRRAQDARRTRAAGCTVSVLDLRPSKGAHLQGVSGVPLDGLATIMRRLLGPGGCPWDREQTHDTLRQYLVEEAAEVLEAVERRQAHTLCGELGDLLLQIAFHSALGEANERFALRDVVGAIEQKMVFRHPHVFAGWKVGGSADVLRNWAELKQVEAAAAGGTAGGETADGGSWRELRKQAVRVSLAALEAAFAASRRDRDRWQEASRSLSSEAEALIKGGSRTLSGDLAPREEETES